MKQIINKTVNLNIVNTNVNAYMLLGLFKAQAKEENWSDDEIDAVVTEAKSGDNAHLIATIKNHCKAKKQRPTIDPTEVGEVLVQLGHYTHYLGTKDIALWDDYDYSNYRSLQIKAGKIKF